MTAPRMTLHVRLVLEHMLTDPSAQHYSYEIARQTLLDPPTVSTILVRLVKAGWLTEELEAGDARYSGSTGRSRGQGQTYDDPPVAGVGRPITRKERCGRAQHQE
jgi:DNA-binding IclR family transcriptional regulator